jgi:hypothetical protein
MGATSHYPDLGERTLKTRFDKKWNLDEGRIAPLDRLSDEGVHELIDAPSDLRGGRQDGAQVGGGKAGREPGEVAEALLNIGKNEQLAGDRIGR